MASADGDATAQAAGQATGEITITDLTKVYEARRGDPVVALDHVTTHVRSGEFVTLVGPSGCGKTTLLNVLAGLTVPTSGSVTIAGGDSAPHVRPGLVFQSPILLPWRTAAENVYLPAETGERPAARTRGEALRERARQLLELVGLERFANTYPWELSGGMQARVAIARALLLDSPVMCLDEPFAALDEFTREQMLLQLLDIWHAQRFTTVFVTHNIFEATFLSDRVLVMTPRPGRVVADVAIDLPRPRHRDMFGSDDFAANVRRIRSAMHEYWEIDER